jgi:hypothetical protein
MHPTGNLILKVSANRKRLLIAENVAGGTKKAQLSLIDLTMRHPQIIWKFSHMAKGRVTSADISSDGKVVGKSHCV